jgi:hypothetical protein
MIAHETWLATGDQSVLKRGYYSLKALVDFFSRKGNTQENGLTTFGFEGDWLGVEGCYPQRSRAWSLPNTSLPGCLLSNMSSATAQIVATSQLVDMARELGRSDDQSHYTALHDKLRSAYNQAFFDADTGSYRGNGTHVWQFANLMPLALNITPQASVPSVLSKLLDSVRSGAHGACASAPCIATGFWGTRFILQTLTRYNQHALAMELATKTDEPSWGYMVSSNRSVGTLWEAWDGGSLDHIAFAGGIGPWLYNSAGYNRRDAWTGQVTLRAPEPWLVGAAAVSRHVTGEGKTGWSWRYHDDELQQKDGRTVAAVHSKQAFEANVTVPLGGQVEVWLQPPPRSGDDDVARTTAARFSLVVRDEAADGAVVWSERPTSEGEGADADSVAAFGLTRGVLSGRRGGEDGAVAVVTLAGGDYQLSAAFE